MEEASGGDPYKLFFYTSPYLRSRQARCGQNARVAGQATSAAGLCGGARALSAARRRGRRLRKMGGRLGGPGFALPGPPALLTCGPWPLVPASCTLQTYEGLAMAFQPEQVQGVQEEVQLREQDFGNFVSGRACWPAAGVRGRALAPSSCLQCVESNLEPFLVVQPAGTCKAGSTGHPSPSWLCEPTAAGGGTVALAAAVPARLFCRQHLFGGPHLCSKTPRARSGRRRSACALAASSTAFPTARAAPTCTIGAGPARADGPIHECVPKLA